MQTGIKQIVDQSKLNGYHLMLMFLCLFAVSAEGYGLVIYGSVISQIMAEWGIDTVYAGMLGSMSLIGMMAGSFVFGLLADRIGCKRIIIISVLLFSIFMGLSGIVNSPALFGCFRLLAGIGMGGVIPNCMALITDYIPKKQRTTIMAVALSGMQVGGTIAPFVSMAAAGGMGWRVCFIFGFVPLLVIPVMVKCLPDSVNYLVEKGKQDKLKSVLQKANPESAGVRIDFTLPAAREKKSSLTALFSKKRALNTVMFWIAFFMGLLMIYGLNTWLPQLMRDAGYELGGALPFLIVLNVAALIGTFILGRIADKVNPRYVLIVLYLVGAASLLLLSIKSSLAVAYILVGVAGICTYGPQNIGNAYIAQYYPGNMRSTGLGVCNMMGRLGGILGPTLGGVLLSAQLSMFTNCLVFAVPGVIAGIAYGFVREKRAGQQHDGDETLRESAAAK